MERTARSIGLMAVTALVTAILMSLGVRGCVNANQNQNNSPISISNSRGRPALAVTCSTDGSIAYVTDGRNVYRYEQDQAADGGTWRCILSQGERLEMAAKHDPREQLPAGDAREKGSERKPSAGESPRKSEAVADP